MSTNQDIEDRVLDIFEHNGRENGLMAEEVFPLYEEKFGDTSRSNSIHTTISRLTKKGLLYVVRKQVSPLTKKRVNVWKFADGSVTVTQVDGPWSLPTASDLRHENETLKLKNKNLEAQVMDLLGKLEAAREGK